MALKDTLKSFVDNIGLAEVFQRKQPDARVLRAPLLKGIGNARRQFDTGKTRVPNRWWSVKNGVVALTVKVKGDTLDINGVATNHMPEDRFSEFLDTFQKAVEAGEFDAELKNHGNGDAEVVIPKIAPRGISPEAAKARGQAAAATRAANKAKKANKAKPAKP